MPIISRQNLHTVTPDTSKQPRIVPQVDRTTKPELPTKPVAVVKQSEVPTVVSEPSIPPQPVEMEVEEPEDIVPVVPESPVKPVEPSPESSSSLSVRKEGIESLYAWEEMRQRAIDAYEANKVNMMHVSAYKIAHDLHLEE